MKKMIALFLVIVLLETVTGCQNEQEQFYSEAIASSNAVSSESNMILEWKKDSNQSVPDITPVPDDDLSGEITIKTYSWSDPDTVYFLAQEFINLHPNVKINFDYDIDMYTRSGFTQAERKQHRENYYARLRTELVSGETDCILYNTAEDLNLFQLSNSGVLVDLQPYWDKDKDIDPDDYFTDVLDAFAADGKMTMIPFSFMLDCVFLSRPVIEKLDVNPDSCLAVSCGDILNWYEQARQEDQNLQLLFSAPGKDTLFSAERLGYIDLNSETATFDTPDFIEFLERTKAVIDEEQGTDAEKIFGWGYAALADERLRYEATGKEPSDVGTSSESPAYKMATKSRLSFAAIEHMQMYELTNFQQPLEFMAGPFPLTSTSGRLGVTSIEDFAVPSGCKNPELAWEFIKYCISEREEPTYTRLGYSSYSYTFDLPINKNNFAMMAEDVPKAVKRAGTPGYAKFDPVDGEMLTEKLEEIFTLDLVNTKQYGVDVSEFLEEYYEKGLTTAQECADKIQGRTELWLGE